MRLIENKEMSIYFHLALERYLMERADEDCFMVWRTSPSIILGKNQNASLEVNLPYARKRGIAVARRLSGGGSILSDGGNLMYSFIRKRKKGDDTSFQALSAPIASALEALGVRAAFSGRNDLTIDGKKCSGAAQYTLGDTLLHHGTLMFDVDVSELTLALYARPIKFQGKGVASFQSRVTNVKDHLKEPLTIQQMQDHILSHTLRAFPSASVWQLPESDRRAVDALRRDVFENPAFVYSQIRPFAMRHETKFPFGIVETALDVKDGILLDVKITGDFFGQKDTADIEHALKNTPFDPASIEQTLSRFALEEYFGKVSPKELAKAFY